MNVRPTAAVNNTALRLDSSVCRLTQWRRSELSSLYSMQLFYLFLLIFFVLKPSWADPLSSLLWIFFFLGYQFIDIPSDIIKRNGFEEPKFPLLIYWYRNYSQSVCECVTDDRIQLSFICIESHICSLNRLWFDGAAMSHSLSKCGLTRLIFLMAEVCLISRK